MFTLHDDHKVEKLEIWHRFERTLEAAANEVTLKWQLALESILQVLANPKSIFIFTFISRHSFKPAFGSRGKAASFFPTSTSFTVMELLFSWYACGNIPVAIMSFPPNKRVTFSLVWYSMPSLLFGLVASKEISYSGCFFLPQEEEDFSATTETFETENDGPSGLKRRYSISPVAPSTRQTTTAIIAIIIGRERPGLFPLVSGWLRKRSAAIRAFSGGGTR